MSRQPSQYNQQGPPTSLYNNPTTTSSDHHQQTQPQQQPTIRQLIPINPNQICGITPSDIDKYSRVVFPVSFICFHLLYWIIYLHISNEFIPGLTLIDKKEV